MLPVTVYCAQLGTDGQGRRNSGRAEKSWAMQTYKIQKNRY